MATYGVIDLTSESPVQVTAQGEGLLGFGGHREFDLGHVRSQLEEIRDAIIPVADGPDTTGGFGLQTLEIDLTLGAEGTVWFIAKGSAEASIKLTFGHPAAGSASTG
jgi:hypothetical protein